jgi:hypothetical protein
MTLNTRIRRHPGTAIFCRNHEVLLEQASAISAHAPQQQIAFRAKTVWRSAEIALRYHGPRPIYFLPILKHGVPDDLIGYVAMLQRVELHSQDTQATRDLLKLSVPQAINEGLWPDNQGKPTVKTIYLIRNCRKVPNHVNIYYYDLRKLADDECIDLDFRYSYAVVHAHSGLVTGV